MHSRINQVWRDHWLKLGNVVEISCPTVTPYAVLEASGHVGEFSDFMTQCLKCEEASRADTLLEAHHPNPDALGREALEALLFETQPACPACGAQEWSKVTALNLMFNTTIGTGASADPASFDQRLLKECSPHSMPFSVTFVNDCRSVLSKLEKATETKSLPGKA